MNDSDPEFWWKQHANGDGRRPVSVPGPSPFKLTMYENIEASPRKLELVENFLGLTDFSALFGAPGSGKSVLAEDMGLHVAAERPWFGRRVIGGAVLYVAAERASVVKRRAAAFRLHHGLDSLPFGILTGWFDLVSSLDHARHIIEHANRLATVTGYPLRLVQLDTVSRMLAGGDENSPRDMGAFVSAAGLVQEETGAHVQVVHHIPADGAQRLRGHGALLGACDVTIAVENSSGQRTATVQKTNDGEEGQCVTFSLQSIELHHDEDTGQVTTAPVVVSSEAQATASKPTRKLSDRQRLAMSALTRLVADRGEPVPTALNLPASVFAVPLAIWREELGRCGAIERDAKNPREDFRRLKDALQARNHIAIRDELVWPV